jgi:8-oxo-dGTP pyrophosphatase MutT (NUDIX family)
MNARARALTGEAATAVVPRPAATTLVVRDGLGGLEVLMVRRSLQASFMPGAYVFPGGAVDAADGAPDAVAACDETGASLRQRIGAVTEVGAAAAAYAVAALRECFEECGLWLGAPTQTAAADWTALRARLHAGETLAALAAAAGLPLASSVLQPWSHWVTPLGLPKRFDTLFFVAPAPPGQVPEVDAGETTTLAWVHPPAALAASARGDFPMEFATVNTVASLQPFASAAALLAHAAALTHLPPLHPRLQLDAEQRISALLLPGQAGYAEALSAASAH